MVRFANGSIALSTRQLEWLRRYRGLFLVVFAAGFFVAIQSADQDNYGDLLYAVGLVVALVGLSLFQRFGPLRELYIRTAGMKIPGESTVFAVVMFLVGIFAARNWDAGSVQALAAATPYVLVPLALYLFIGSIIMRQRTWPRNPLGSAAAVEQRARAEAVATSAKRKVKKR